MRHVICFFVILFFSSAGYLPAQENADLMKRIISEIYNDQNFEVMDELVASDYVEYTNGIRTETPAAIKETIFWLIKVAPDFKITIEDIISEKEKVVIRWMYAGTNQRVGKEISLEGVFIGLFEDGKLKTGWQYFDNLSRFKQLGYVLVPPAELQEK